MIMLLTMYLKHFVDKMSAKEELYRLNDRELQDIGISRTDIPSILKGTYCNG